MSVLWVVIILTMLAAAVQTLSATSATAEAHVRARASADAALDAGIVRATTAIITPDPNARWPVDGSEEAFRFARYDIRIAVEDVRGGIDLNAADETVLRQLLIDAGLSGEDAAALTDKILDWRSATPLRRLHGATDADYAPRGYRQRHGPFQSVDELKLVLGMTPAIFAKIAPALTVYSHQPGVDPGVATRQALLAMFAGNVAAADRTLAERQELESASPGSLPAGVLNPAMPLSGRAFTIKAVLNAGPQHFTRQATVEMTGDPRRPWLVLDWR